MQSILVGSPGVGKSTVICLMAFYLVLNRKKNVLLYRQLDKRYCLLYLGLEDDRIIYFSVENCGEDQAVRIYKSLEQKQELWLLLDGFRYKSEIPQQLMAFNILATSQQVDLKSRVDMYCCLLPCWSKADLRLLGEHVFNYTADDMDERYYYSGGSVREFTLASTKQMITNIQCAISAIEGAVHLLSYRSDFLSHLFVKNVNDRNDFTRFRCRESVIDSEFVVRHLSVRICAADLHRTFEWTRSAGCDSLAEIVFKTFLLRLAAENSLELFVSEYPIDPARFKMRRLALKRGAAACLGTNADCGRWLNGWNDEVKLSYSFPACYACPNIASIAKVESTFAMDSNVAYLCMTVATEFKIDSQQLQKMDAVFHAHAANGNELPICVVVSPDLESCKALELETDATHRVFVGYSISR